jgi:pimeloyl-ACP methyl ester carboxylesterase
MLKRMLKFGLWAVAALLAVVCAIFAYGYYQVVSFDTTTLPVNFGKVDAELFVGGEPPPRPLIVGFGGAEGGNAWASDHWKEQRDRFLNSGYSFLAIGYFGSKGLPEKLDRISLDAIHAAIAEAAADPRVNTDCVALMGGSKGGELALALASHYPDIDAVVGIVPGSAAFAAHTDAMTTSSWTYEGKPLPFVPVPWKAAPALIGGDMRGAYEIMLEDTEAVQKARLPVERINGPIFFLSARKDEFWPSTKMSEAVVASLKQNGFKHFVEHVAVDGSHASPLERFDLVEQFLAKHFLERCRDEGRTPVELGAQP